MNTVYVNQRGEIVEAMQWRGHMLSQSNIEYIISFEEWFERVAPKATIRYKGNDLYNHDGRFMIAKPSDWIVSLGIGQDWSVYTDTEFHRLHRKGTV